MKRQPKDSRLSLERETIRTLNHGELSEVSGGTSSTVCATIIIIVTAHCGKKK